MTDHWFDKHIKDLLRNYKTRVPAGLWNKVSLDIKNELFDEHVKDALTTHESNVPKGLWEKIEAEQKKDRKPVAWWQNTAILTGIAALLLLMIGGYYYTTHSTKENTGTATTTHSSNMGTTGTHGTNNNNSNSSQPVGSIPPGTSSNEQEGTGTTAGANTSAQQENIAHTGSNNNPSTVTTTGDQPSSLSTGADATHLYASRLWKKDRAGKNNKEHTTTDNSALAPATAENDITTPGGINTTATQPNANNSTTLQYGATQRYLVAGQAALVATPFNKLDNDGLATIQNLKSAHSFSLACPNTIRPTWFLEVYGSPDYTMQSLHATGASNIYLKRKDSTETMEGGFTIGARLSRTINEHWQVKSGLQYAQVNQRFSVRTENEIKTTTVITTRAVVRNPGDTTFVSDTSQLTQVGYRLRTTQNRYRSIEIPLIATYETGNYNWHWGISGGVIINAASWYSGEMLDTSYNIVPLSAKSTNGVYRSAVNLSAYLGVSVSHRIGNDMEVFAEPYFRYGLFSSSISNLGYSQSFNAAGISLGIRYQLNNKGSKYSR